MLNINHVRILEQAGLLRYISPHDYEKTVEELNVISMKYVNNQVVLRQDEKATQIAIVVNGEVKAEKIHGSGSDNMAHSYLDGSIFGYEGVLSSNRMYAMDYISDGDSYIALVSIEDINKSSFANEIMQGIITCMADDSIKNMYRVEVISKKKLRERILTYLRIKESELGIDAFTLNVSREQLAQELCVNRSALSNELSEMQRDGLIKVEKRRITMLK